MTRIVLTPPTFTNMTSRAEPWQRSLHNPAVVYQGPPTADNDLQSHTNTHKKHTLFHFLHFIPWEVCQVALGPGFHDDYKVVLMSAQRWMSHSVGGLASSLSK